MIGTNYCFQVEKEVEAEGFTWDLALELNFKGKHRIAKIKKRKGLFLEKTKGADGHRRRVAIHPNTLGSHGKKRSPDEQQRSKCLHVAGTVVQPMSPSLTSLFLILCWMVSQSRLDSH